jgi:hypothetical protein
MEIDESDFSPTGFQGELRWFSPLVLSIGWV